LTREDWSCDLKQESHHFVMDPKKSPKINPTRKYNKKSRESTTPEPNSLENMGSRKKPEPMLGMTCPWCWACTPSLLWTRASTLEPNMLELRIAS